MDFRGIGIDSAWRSTKQESSRFSFQTSDFNLTNLKYKDTIRSIFFDNWFPKIDKKGAIVDKVSMASLNRSIQLYKKANPQKFDLLYNYDLRGLGPGEVLLYLIVNDSHLGGGSSAASDLIIGSSTYEIKSSKRNVGGGFYHDFRFGKTIDDDAIKGELLALGKKSNLINQNITNSSSLAIPGTKMKEIADKNKEEFEDIEKRYCSIVKKYLGNTSLVVFDRNDGLIKFSEKGNSFKENDVGIYRIATGTIEPLIRV